MRKLRNILLLAAAISLFTGFSAYAENYWWVNALGEWGYRANDGNLRDGWYWIDGNRDGSAECYYFQLYSLLTDTVTPDGYQGTVRARGRWTEWSRPAGPATRRGRIVPATPMISARRTRTHPGAGFRWRKTAGPLTSP